MSKSVFVVGTDSSVRNMFRDRGWSVSGTIKDADALCFTGGADISPLLYGQKIHPRTYPDLPRDMEEVAIWKSVSPSKPKLGICRGHQLGNVLSGGSMWQDVDHHNGLIVHDIVRQDSKSQMHRKVNSLHHQMIKPTDEAIIIATAERATRMEDFYQTVKIDTRSAPEEVEAVYYYNTNFLGVQWHPEYEHKDSRDLFFELIDEYIHFNKKKG